MDGGALPSFGALLKRHRLARGLTQEALAERAQISAFTISALERGVSQRPQMETLDLLATAPTLSAQDRTGLVAAARRLASAAPATREAPWVPGVPPNHGPRHPTTGPSLAACSRAPVCPSPDAHRRYRPDGNARCRRRTSHTAA
jgi:DNA-binding XRE family transcriptional regulator